MGGPRRLMRADECRRLISRHALESGNRVETGYAKRALSPPSIRISGHTRPSTRTATISDARVKDDWLFLGLGGVRLSLPGGALFRVAAAGSRAVPRETRM